MTWLFAWAAMGGLMALSALAGGGQPADELLQPDAWSPHPDGGRTVAITATPGPSGGPALRLRYDDAPPHWGNVVARGSVPPDATALRFQVRRIGGSSLAAMHVLLLERDGDLWLREVRPGGGAIGVQRSVWLEVRLPVSSFTHEPRGDRRRAMVTVDRLLLGCNFGDLEVEVADLRWERRAPVAPEPLDRTPDLQIARGPRGAVGVIDMGAGLPEGFRSAHPPAAMLRALRAGGYGATLLRPGDLADPAVLTRERLDAVVLSCGPFFPAPAREAFLAYLRAGGSFLSTDGYAFDRLVERSGSTWVDQGSGTTAAETDTPTADAPSMNTRHGRTGDAITFSTNQIPVFDPAFQLQHVARLRVASRFRPARGGPTFGTTGRISGYAACGLTGLNNPVFPPVYRRWEPVVEALDADGQPRGAAVGLMRNHAGPFAGSVWAFSGITSGQDLFLATPARRALLIRLMDALVTPLTLHGLRSDLACYREGETARLSVRCTNRGRARARTAITLRVAGRTVASRTLDLNPGETREVEAAVPVRGLRGHLIRFAAEATCGATQTTQRIDSAFCIWRQEVIDAGPRVAWEGNYLTIDGRAAFLAGTNQTGMMFYSDGEGPAVWDRDLRMMAANNVRILRILHFSPFAKDGYRGVGAHGPADLAARPARLRRQLDAIVLLAHAHRVTLFLSLHDWQAVGLTDAELAHQADWNRFWAARYRSAPGLFFDVQNEPTVDVPNRPDIVALWNAFLRARYGADDALRAAWGARALQEALPNVPLPDLSDDWGDVRSADRKRFETELLNRWVRANVDGLRAGNPRALVTVGYLPTMSQADKILGTRYTDFSNMHYYGSLEVFPLELKLIDRRAYGKGFSLGEFGAQEAHSARNQGASGLPEEPSIRRYRQAVHFSAGMGASFAANWCWKELDEMVFPWGLVERSTPVARPWLHTFAQTSLLASFATLAWRPPSTVLLVPDSHRIGPRFDEIHRGLQRAVRLLLDARVDFAVMNEEDLQQVPPETRLVVWPLPYCPSDEAFGVVRRWVEAGGTLYVSGSLAYDSARRPSRSDRHAALGLPPDPGPPPFQTPEEGWAAPVIEARPGRGRVLYVPYPLELRPRPGDAAVYARAIEVAGVRPIALEPATAPVHAHSVATAAGGRLTALVRTDQDEGRLRVTLPDSGATVELRPGGSAFVLTDRTRRVVAAESEGAIEVGGRRLAEASGHFGLASLDGAPLVSARSLLVLPHQQRSVRLPGLPLARGGAAAVGPMAHPRRRSQPANGEVRVGVGHVAVIATSDRMASALESLRRALQGRAPSTPAAERSSRAPRTGRNGAL
ncbi:MAG TPA: beta-galactosidase [Chthonomonadales bacterium]|nr:beta-galactosidase [Chthonomonadales bacterium]